MSREEIQMRMDEVEKQIESVEAEIAHLDMIFYRKYKYLLKNVVDAFPDK